MSQVIRLAGPLTLDTATRHVGALDALPGNEPVTVDLSQVTATDSAAVALLLAWTRKAAGQGQEIRFACVPAGLRSLIGVYGLTGMLPVRD